MPEFPVPLRNKKEFDQTSANQVPKILYHDILSDVLRTSHWQPSLHFVTVVYFFSILMKCLILGGGVGGLISAKHLRKVSKDVEIILVEPKQYVEIFWAAYRSPFDEETAKDALYDLEPFCKANNVEHKQTVVTELTATKAILKNGDEIEFDVCVVATGTDYSWAACGRGIHKDGGKDARWKTMKEEGDRLVKNASSVLIVGGGLIGTELAGDVAFHQNKKSTPGTVTLVHSGAHLCPEMGPKPAGMIKSKLEKLGVRIILNDRVKTGEDGKMTLQSNEEDIKADAVVMTIGNKPINSFIQEPSWLDEKGWVQSDEFFRVKGAGGKVFALGDCSNLLQNSAVKIIANAAVLGKNIKATMDAISAGKDLDSVPMGKYVDSSEPIVATIGPKDGVAKIGSTHTQYMLPRFKNYTMFFFKIKSDLGLT